MALKTFDDVNGALKDIAVCETFLAEKEAKMNEKINELKSKYDEETADSRAKKQMLEKELEGFCKINKDEFGKQKSKPMLFGIVFFRTSPPKVGQLNKKYSVATSLELIKKLFKNKFIRKKEEIDKEEILSAYSGGELDDQKLAAVGLKIDQDEKFGYELNWEKLSEAR